MLVLVEHYHPLMCGLRLRVARAFSRSLPQPHPTHTQSASLLAPAVCRKALPQKSAHRLGVRRATECEIFLSMLAKFMEANKLLWQRVTAVEAAHILCKNPDLLVALTR